MMFSNIQEIGVVLARIPASLRDEVRQFLFDGDEDEFWEFYDWVMALPEAPTEAIVEAHLRALDPFWAADEELEEKP